MVDDDIKQAVENALDWEAAIDSKDIGVSVAEGVVTLRGSVASYGDKLAAERVALHVYGVKAVANDLSVRLRPGLERTDTDIAQAAVAALNWNTRVPYCAITLTVTNGWVTLKGTVPWQYQKDAAARSVRDLAGVKALTNEIVVKAQLKATDVRDKIEAAFKRSAEIDARRINVNAVDGKVILSGVVHSWGEREAAERAVWSAPGVTQLEDRLAVVP